MSSLMKERYIMVFHLSEEGKDFLLYLEIHFVGKGQICRSWLVQSPSCVREGTGRSWSESRKGEGVARVMWLKKIILSNFLALSMKKNIGWKAKKLRWLEALSYTNGRVSSFFMGVNNRWKSKSDNKGSGRLRECVQPE